MKNPLVLYKHPKKKYIAKAAAIAQIPSHIIAVKILPFITKDVINRIRAAAAVAIIESSTLHRVTITDHRTA